MLKNMNTDEICVSIRKMRLDDIDDIKRIYELITKKALQEDFRELVENPCEKRVPGSNCFVAEFEGKVVGFMISFVMAFSFGMEKSAWIATMGVEPKHMGKQIGARLARETFAFYKAQGINNLNTSVQWDATDVVSFFKTLGFHRSDFINLEKSL
jgi:N-acetylglutamate synthase-like GNAT family acetyltransferase